jgi:hypothetical protein
MGVKKNDGETWDAECELNGCGHFTSLGHPTKKAAQERLDEHQLEPHGVVDVVDTQEED